MGNPASPRPSRTSVVLLVVVVLALCVGAAASLVASAASAPAYQPGPIQDFYLNGSQLAYIFLAGFAVVAGLFVWVWLSRGRQASGHAALMVLLLILALCLLVALLHGVAPGRTAPSTSVGPGTPGTNNSTGTAPPPTNNSTGVVSSPGPSLNYDGIHFPSWTLFAVVAAGALVAGALLAPALWRRAQDPTARNRALRAAEVDRARGALQSASYALGRGEEPRDVIVRLYASLLERVAPLVGTLDSDTPEEIRTTHLVALGIRPAAAAVLTRLFEEARYSSHPMGPDAAARATEAIAIARADLDRVRPEL